MNKDFRVFHNKKDYEVCLKHEHIGKVLPQNITDFPAYVVYDNYMDKWYKVSYQSFIGYLNIMRDELLEQLGQVMCFLNETDDD